MVFAGIFDRGNDDDGVTLPRQKSKRRERKKCRHNRWTDKWRKRMNEKEWMDWRRGAKGYWKWTIVRVIATAHGFRFDKSALNSRIEFIWVVVSSLVLRAQIQCDRLFIHSNSRVRLLFFRQCAQSAISQLTSRLLCASCVWVCECRVCNVSMTMTTDRPFNQIEFNRRERWRRPTTPNTDNWEPRRNVIYEYETELHANEKHTYQAPRARTYADNYLGHSHTRYVCVCVRA